MIPSRSASTAQSATVNQLHGEYMLSGHQPQHSLSAASAEVSASSHPAQIEHEDLLQKLQASREALQLARKAEADLLGEVAVLNKQAQQDRNAQASLLEEVTALKQGAQQHIELQAKHDSLLEEVQILEQRAQQDSEFARHFQDLQIIHHQGLLQQQAERQHASELLQSFAQKLDDAMAKTANLEQQLAALQAKTAIPEAVQAELDYATRFIAELKHRLSMYSSFYQPPWVKDLDPMYSMSPYSWLHDSVSKAAVTHSEQTQQDIEAQVHTRVEESDVQLASLRAESQDFKQLQQEHQDVVAQVTKLEQQLASADSDRERLKRLQHQHDASTVQIANLQQQLLQHGELQKQYGAVTAQVGNLQRQLTQHGKLQQQHEAVKAQVIDLEATFQAQREKLITQRDALRAERVLLWAELEAMSSQHEALQLRHQQELAAHQALQVLLLFC